MSHALLRSRRAGLQRLEAGQVVGSREAGLFEGGFLERQLRVGLENCSFVNFSIPAGRVVRGGPQITSPAVVGGTREGAGAPGARRASGAGGGGGIAGALLPKADPKRPPAPPAERLRLAAPNAEAAIVGLGGPDWEGSNACACCCIWGAKAGAVLLLLLDMLVTPKS